MLIMTSSMITLLNTYSFKQITEAPHSQAAINFNSVAWLCGWIYGSKCLHGGISWPCKQQQRQECKPIKTRENTVFFSSSRNTTGSLGEWETLWKHECYMYDSIETHCTICFLFLLEDTVMKTEAKLCTLISKMSIIFSCTIIMSTACATCIYVFFYWVITQF